MTSGMKKIGIIGGLSPESTQQYIQGLHAGAKAHFGDNHNAKLVVSYVDFQEFIEMKERGEWDKMASILAAEAVALERAGCDLVILATNTMHKVAGAIEQAIGVPFLHLADATADRILEAGFDKIALLGTRYTMEMDFYKERLEHKNIEVLVPDEKSRTLVNDVIYNELCHGEVKDVSRVLYQDIIKTLKDQGAQGVILGCTEIGMLISDPSESALPIFDTTEIHIETALSQGVKS